MGNVLLNDQKKWTHLDLFLITIRIAYLRSCHTFRDKHYFCYMRVLFYKSLRNRPASYLNNNSISVPWSVENQKEMFLTNFILLSIQPFLPLKRSRKFQQRVPCSYRRDCAATWDWWVQLVPETRINRREVEVRGGSSQQSSPSRFSFGCVPLLSSSTWWRARVLSPALSFGTRKGNRCSGSSVFRDNCDWSRGQNSGRCHAMCLPNYLKVCSGTTWSTRASC